MEKNKSIIFGYLGQDGSYMADLLKSKNYEIYGIVKNNSNNINLFEFDIDNIYDIINYIRPSEIYNFAGVSDVFNPWENLDTIFNINALLPQKILETIVKIDKNIKFFQASSCLTFGRDTSGYQDENTPKNPIHPYGIAKLYADNMINEFRNIFGLYCCSGILFNHNSPRMRKEFFAKKVIKSAIDIKNKKQDKLMVGNLSVVRDYGYAPDFVEAASLMMNNIEPKDYVIGTGKLISMKDYIKKVFEYLDLDYKQYIEVDDRFIRNNDTNILCANINNIKNDLGWKPTHSIDDIIRIMIEKELEIQ